MDIVKLLTRSTKKSDPSKTLQRANSNHLPSAGKQPNPQLFHDVVGDIRGKKRKRGPGDYEEAKPDEETEESIDYFAPKSIVKSTQSASASQAVSIPPYVPTEHLSGEECRQILLSHRIKISLFSIKSSKATRVKKVKRAQMVSQKHEIRQIYPQPLESFTDLQKYGVSKRLGQNLAQQGYRIPTEVQMGSLPLLLKPEIAFKASEESDLSNTPEIDLLAVAPTGSGKTLAFLIPALNGITQRRRTNEDTGKHRLEAVVVAPTKELASQIDNEGKKLSLGTGIKVVLMRKGMNIASTTGNQNEDMESESETEESDSHDAQIEQHPPVKTDVLVTTPLNLVHALSSATLPTVRTLILDEADVLLDPLFRSQTLQIWNACTNAQLQVTLWSATIGSSIENLATSTILSRRASLDLPTSLPIIRIVVGLKDSAIPNITHRLVYAATEAGKLLALRQLLHPSGSIIDDGPALRPPFLVFTSTIPRAQALYSELLYDIPLAAGGSSRIAVLHSSLSSTAREDVMTRFRKGEIWVLVTTDLLARGVDFKGINGVVNYDVPGSAALYVHRVGRTGRAGREGGIAVTYYTKEDVEMGLVRGVVGVIKASEEQAGKKGAGESWLLGLLPKMGKGERERIKRKRREGVEEGGRMDGKGGGRISTKSGYDRRLEKNRRGAIEGSRRRKLAEEENNAGEEGELEWDGFGND